MMNLLVALFLQTAVAQGPFPVQLGFALDRDTVTVGDHVTLIVRVLGPHGAQFAFPAGPDTVHKPGTFPVELIGKRATTMQGDTAVAGYRLAAWDVGTQPVNISDVVVTYRGRQQLVPISGINLFVRSVLPKDTTLRKPKPARDLIALTSFDWKKWLPLLLLLLLALLGWWLWLRYRRRAAMPLDPYQRAKAEFARVAREHPAEREPAVHLAMMVDVMRDYLAARVTGVRRSYTTSELLPKLELESEAERSLPAMLGRTDLVKFARETTTPVEAQGVGDSARVIVDTVEARIVAAEAAEKNAKREKAA
ncbi:MAG: hypothetical protein M3Z17_08105 [Gemmatimonadota bacterium]|nr:hypothetical protein [Gemmatimonadota bacterium]